MNAEQAIKIIECFFRENDNKCANGECDFANPMCQYDREAAFDLALAALRAQQEKENPLSLEQLREIAKDESVVWIAQDGDDDLCGDGWAKPDFEYAEKGKVNIWWPGSEVEDEPLIENYGKTWLAYAREPKEG